MKSFEVLRSIIFFRGGETLKYCFLNYDLADLRVWRGAELLNVNKKYWGSNIIEVEVNKTHLFHVLYSYGEIRLRNETFS